MSANQAIRSSSNSDYDVDLTAVILESGALTVSENGTQSFDIDQFLDYLIDNDKELELKVFLERFGINDLEKILKDIG